LSSDYFIERYQQDTSEGAQIFAWHLQAHNEGGLPLPYSPTQTYVNCDVHLDEKPYGINREATLAMLAKVVDYARRRGADVSKDYQHDFSLRFCIPGTEIELTYEANRETVCTKIVVGTEEVPEYVRPAYTKEIVEWDCEPVSLRKVGASNDAG
jgi:hypothetical protein